MFKVFVAGFLLAMVAMNPAVGAPLIVHEWGTFTALQDDDGNALGSINADDEPVPGFVCRAGFMPIAQPGSQLTPTLEGGKGIMPCHPGVTMRLETPVIYFYPGDESSDKPLDVHVKFRGGWLTEFYPRAKVDAPGLLNSQVTYPPLTAESYGSLAWDDVQLNAPGALTPTDDPVWTAPREVPRAAPVGVPTWAGEPDPTTNRPEKFFFYRGVGHLDSPLRAVRDPNTDRLRLVADLSAMGNADALYKQMALEVPAAWLIEIRSGDGFCAFRPVTSTSDRRLHVDHSLDSVPASFAPADFRPDRLGELRAAMRAELVHAGLYPEEATAMLKTWELSYFKSPGRRVFYVTPRAWTDRVLPLTIDGAAIARAMIGRIELVTPTQRALLARIAAGPCPDMTAFSRQCWDALNARSTAYTDARNKTPAAAQVPFKRPSLTELNIPIPAVYQSYLDLGRFRDALLLDEQTRHPTRALAAFLAGNGLQVLASR